MALQVIAAKINTKGNLFDIVSVKAGVKRALDKTAKPIKADFESTVKTWTNKPTVIIESPSESERNIGIDSKIFSYIDLGTRSYTIRAKRARYLFFAGGGQFRAKTMPGVLGSGNGNKGTRNTFAKSVRHPGIKKRDFSILIAKRHSSELQKNIDQELSGL